MSSILKVDTIQTTAGAAPTAKDLGFAAGSVLQVVRGIGTAGSTTSSSTSFVAEGIQATITPKFNNSLILVQAMTGDSNSGGYSFYRVTNTTDNHNVCSAPTGNFSASPQELKGVTLFGMYLVNSTATRTFRVEGRSHTSSTRYQRYEAYTDDGVTSGRGIIILSEIAQ